MNPTTQPWETPHFGRGWGLIGTGEERTRGGGCWEGEEPQENGNSAGASSRFIWGRDSEALEKGRLLKLRLQTGRGGRKGVVTRRHWCVNLKHPSHTHTHTLFCSGVSQIQKENWIILLSGSLNSVGKTQDNVWEQFNQPWFQSARKRGRLLVTSWLPFEMILSFSAFLFISITGLTLQHRLRFSNLSSMQLPSVFLWGVNTFCQSRHPCVATKAVNCKKCHWFG